MAAVARRTAKKCGRVKHKRRLVYLASTRNLQHDRSDKTITKSQALCCTVVWHNNGRVYGCMLMAVLCVYVEIHKGGYTGESVFALFFYLIRM